jgi:hypothetical protein
MHTSTVVDVDAGPGAHTAISLQTHAPAVNIDVLLQKTTFVQEACLRTNHSLTTVLCSFQLSKYEHHADRPTQCVTVTPAHPSLYFVSHLGRNRIRSNQLHFLDLFGSVDACASDST